MIFVDASVLLAAENADDREHQAALALLRSGDLATLELALYETTNVAIARWKDLDAADRLARRIWAVAELGTLVRVDRQLGSEVAPRHLARPQRLRRGLCRRRFETRGDTGQLRRTRSRPPWISPAAVHTHSQVTQKRAWSPMLKRRRTATDHGTACLEFRAQGASRAPTAGRLAGSRNQVWRELR